MPHRAFLTLSQKDVHQPKEKARMMHGIAIAKPRPKMYRETYESGSFSGKIVRFMVKNAATNYNGEKIIVTIVKTSTARPCLAPSNASLCEDLSWNAL